MKFYMFLFTKRIYVELYSYFSQTSKKFGSFQSFDWRKGILSLFIVSWETKFWCWFKYELKQTREEN
jgi:hypothetical protein